MLLHRHLDLKDALIRILQRGHFSGIIRIVNDCIMDLT